jgi:predicted kinase
LQEGDITKTTLDDELTQKTIAIDKDDLTDPKEYATRGGQYGGEVYDLIYGEVEKALTVGITFFLDAPHMTNMQREGWRRNMQGICQKTESGLLVLQVYAPMSVVRQRMVERAGCCRQILCHERCC